MQRLVALLIMLIPGIIGVIGVKLMRDVLFGIVHRGFFSLTLQFIIGLLMLLGGLAFVGGFIFYRDRKRNKVQPKFQRKPSS
ncbi:hypothetical protein A374_01004 [Fictibacillus macauensis ZFHKF-1]|uniref:DUF2627 domain-containing protein n=1 Tax=Fictibacillus macauensis ZFHKF-1 TaxID=1196324 RepID=I8UKA7_9BACL|nr:DUF2627 domain-containing protein [Fictibacillus macauensis]EIT87315.1 hypothetical protein A374_01004 [Fictibacillus macauensis ZFHKF-1]